MDTRYWSSFTPLRRASILVAFLFVLVTIFLVASFSVVECLCFMILVFLKNLSIPILSRISVRFL